jgi:type III restriction enzyme
MEHHAWSLLDHPARLDEAAFTIRDAAQSYEIDIAGRRVVYSFSREERQLPLALSVEGFAGRATASGISR